MAVYFAHAEGTDRVKIGWGVNPERRVKELQTGSAQPLKIIRVIEGGRETEAAFHRHFQARRIKPGEWFQFSDEMLTASPAAVAPLPNAAFREAVEFLGGQVATGEALGKAQSVISDWANISKPPLDACMKVERITDGRFTCEQMRPDLAELIQWFRSQHRSAA
jgi:DNA-binding transcriptional regulator YdaS (Cro superfamily)